MLVEGRIVIPESSAAIEPGAIFGEMALFTVAGWRTASAVCASDVRLHVITYEQFDSCISKTRAALGGASVSATD